MTEMFVSEGGFIHIQICIIWREALADVFMAVACNEKMILTRNPLSQKQKLIYTYISNSALFMEIE